MDLIYVWYVFHACVVWLYLKNVAYMSYARKKSNICEHKQGHNDGSHAQARPVAWGFSQLLVMIFWYMLTSWYRIWPAYFHISHLNDLHASLFCTVLHISHAHVAFLFLNLLPIFDAFLISFCALHAFLMRFGQCMHACISKHTCIHFEQNSMCLFQSACENAKEPYKKCIRHAYKCICIVSK